jgi:hypothetical protein
MDSAASPGPGLFPPAFPFSPSRPVATDALVLDANKRTTQAAYEINAVIKKLAIDSSKMVHLHYMQNKDAHDRQLKPPLQEIRTQNNRPCGFTTEVLQTFLVGRNRDELIKATFISPADNEQLKNFANTVRENGKALTTLSQDHFVPYFIKLIEDTPERDGHFFTVIQYIDEDATIMYALFQSYLFKKEGKEMGYTLHAYLSQNNNKMSEEEFNCFFEFISNVMKTERWTSDLLKEWGNFFKVTNEYEEGEKNFYSDAKSEVEISHGLTTMEAVALHSAEFEQFKLSVHPMCDLLEAEY